VYYFAYGSNMKWAPDEATLLVGEVRLGGMPEGPSLCNHATIAAAPVRDGGCPS
jgi:hypothetical protein